MHGRTAPNRMCRPPKPYPNESQAPKMTPPPRVPSLDGGDPQRLHDSWEGDGADVGDDRPRQQQPPEPEHRESNDLVSMMLGEPRDRRGRFSRSCSLLALDKTGLDQARGSFSRGHSLSPAPTARLARHDSVSSIFDYQLAFQQMKQEHPTASLGALHQITLAQIASLKVQREEEERRRREELRRMLEEDRLRRQTPAMKALDKWVGKIKRSENMQGTNHTVPLSDSLRSDINSSEHTALSAWTTWRPGDIGASEHTAGSTRTWGGVWAKENAQRTGSHESFLAQFMTAAAGKKHKARSDINASEHTAGSAWTAWRPGDIGASEHTAGSARTGGGGWARESARSMGSHDTFLAQLMPTAASKMYRQGGSAGVASATGGRHDSVELDDNLALRRAADMYSVCDANSLKSSFKSYPSSDWSGWTRVSSKDDVVDEDDDNHVSLMVKVSTSDGCDDDGDGDGNEGAGNKKINENADVHLVAKVSNSDGGDDDDDEVGRNNHHGLCLVMKASDDEDNEGVGTMSSEKEPGDTTKRAIGNMSSSSSDHIDKSTYCSDHIPHARSAGDLIVGFSVNGEHSSPGSTCTLFDDLIVGWSDHSTGSSGEDWEGGPVHTIPEPNVMPNHDGNELIVEFGHHGNRHCRRRSADF